MLTRLSIGRNPPLFVRAHERGSHSLLIRGELNVRSHASSGALVALPPPLAARASAPLVSYASAACARIALAVSPPHAVKNNTRASQQRALRVRFPPLYRPLSLCHCTVLYSLYCSYSVPAPAPLMRSAANGRLPS